MIDNPYYNYYAVDDRKYATRLQALVATSNNSKSIKWHLPNFEKNIESLDLVKEPNETLDFLYKERAEQLRASYDHLILHYSGGHDSHNILETFMFNNIFIDEILILNPFDRTFREHLENIKFKYLHLSAYEPEMSAIPLAKHFIQTYSPHTKLTIVENTFNIHAKYWLDLSEKQIIDNLSLPGTLGMIGKTPIRVKNLNLYNIEYKKLKEFKNVVHIWGRDKVSVKYDDIGYFFRFDDGSITDFINGHSNYSTDGLPQNVEFFYTHPSCAKLLLKQAHVIMNKVPFYNLLPKLATRAHEDMLASILYNRKIQTSYQSLKPGDFFKDKSPIEFAKGDLNLYHPSELTLLKTQDLDLTRNFNFQTEFLGKILKCRSNEVENFISQNYGGKKFYIKYFNS